MERLTQFGTFDEYELNSKFQNKHSLGYALNSYL